MKGYAVYLMACSQEPSEEARVVDERWYDSKTEARMVAQAWCAREGYWAALVRTNSTGHEEECESADLAGLNDQREVGS